MTRHRSNACPVKRANASRKPRGPTGGRARPGLKTQSLLILHLDADKLRADGLHLGEVAECSGAISSSVLGASVTIEDVTSVSSLLALFGGYAATGRTFDVVVVVAHSNAQGIRVARDQFVGWEAFARYLKPFKPRRLLLVACRGGRSDAGEALFLAIPRLRRIFACPVNASRDFGALMLFSVPYVVAERAPKDRHVLFSQITSIAATGRQLREWRRTTDKSNPDSGVFDLLADLFDPIARQVPDALKSLMIGFLGR